MLMCRSIDVLSRVDSNDSAGQLAVVEYSNGSWSSTSVSNVGVSIFLTGDSLIGS